jgi:hypothetical protein
MDASIVSKSFLTALNSADTFINSQLRDGSKLKTCPAISVGSIFHQDYPFILIPYKISNHAIPPNKSRWK